MSIPKSLRNHLPSDTSKWKMMLMNPNYSMIIVEGATDKILFESFFKRPTIIDFPRPDPSNPNMRNKKSVIAALYELSRLNVTDVAGIVDADYDRIENKLHKKSNLFYTDEHDIEIQIIKSDAFKKFLDNSRRFERLKDFSEKKNFTGEWNNNMRSLIVNLAFKIGIYRMVAFSLNPGIPFPKIDESVCSLDMEFKEDFILAELERSGFDRKQVIQTHEEISNLMKPRLAYQIAKGHDASCLLAIALRSAISDMSAITNAEVEERLRMSYEFLDFKKSKLYRNLMFWAKKEGTRYHTKR